MDADDARAIAERVHAAGRDENDAMLLRHVEDRRLHPRVRSDGWSPPYELGLRRLHEATAGERYQRV